MTTQDADLIREIEIEAEALSNYQSTDLECEGTIDLLRRAAARIKELTQRGEVVVSKVNGAIVAVTRQDEEGRVLDIIAQAEQPAPQTKIDKIDLSVKQVSVEVPEGHCPHEHEPRGCYRVRCQLGRVCVARGEADKAVQPAPLTLSAEDAEVWGSLVAAAIADQDGPATRAILAVDALLRQRVTPLTKADIFAKAEATLTRIQQDDWAATDADVLEFARAVEAAHGIGGEA